MIIIRLDWGAQKRMMSSMTQSKKGSQSRVLYCVVHTYGDNLHMIQTKTKILFTHIFLLSNHLFHVLFPIAMLRNIYILVLDDDDYYDAADRSFTANFQGIYKSAVIEEEGRADRTNDETTRGETPIFWTYLSTHEVDA